MFRNLYTQFSVVLGFLSLMSFFVMVNLMLANSAYYINFNLLALSNFDIIFSVCMDKMTMMFCTTVLLISALVFFYCNYYLDNDKRGMEFSWVMLSFIISMCFFIVSSSFLTVLMGWEGLGISSFLLILYYQNSRSSKGAFVTLLTNRIGDCLLLSSIVVFVSCGSSLFYLPASLQICSASILLIIAAMTKSAQLPFNAWLPMAMAAPTPVSSLVHSSTLVTAGVYLLMRFEAITFSLSTVMHTVSFLSAVTVIVSALSALFETDLKKLIALSTMSNIGLMFFLVMMGEKSVAYFHLTTHSFAKACLFLCAGVGIHSSQSVQDLRGLGLVFKQMPLVLTSANISVLALGGLPFLSVWASKHAIIQAVENSQINVLSMGLIMVSPVLTLAYSTRLLKALNFSIGGTKNINAVGCPWPVIFPICVLAGLTIISAMFYQNLTFCKTPSMFGTEMEEISQLMLPIGMAIGLLLPQNAKMNSWWIDPMKMSEVTGSTPFLNYWYSNPVRVLETTWVEPIWYTQSKLLQFIMQTPSSMVFPNNHQLPAYLLLWIFSFGYMSW